MSLPSTQRAVLVEEVGGPDVLQYRTNYKIPTPERGQVLVKNTFSGINFIDTYIRTGLYPSPKPEVLGREASGKVVALGPGADEYGLEVGDRVAWLGSSGYAEYTAAPAAKTVRIPQGISDQDAVAGFMSGLTVLALARSAYEVRPGNWVLLHAAAGGTGLLMTQVLKTMGANVIGTAGGQEKVALVKSLGADHVIDYRSESGKEWVTLVKEITDGQGVDVVYDSVGKDTWEGSLEVVKRQGTVVWFGNASGPVPPLPLNRLAPKCVKVVRPSLLGYITTRAEFEQYCDILFEMLAKGQLKVKIHKIYRLEDVSQAHEDLESRKTTGKALIQI